MTGQTPHFGHVFTRSSVVLGAFPLRLPGWQHLGSIQRNAECYQIPPLKARHFWKIRLRQLKVGHAEFEPSVSLWPPVSCEARGFPRSEAHP